MKKGVVVVFLLASLFFVSFAAAEEDCAATYGSDYSCYNYNGWVDAGMPQPVYDSDCSGAGSYCALSSSSGETAVTSEESGGFWGWWSDLFGGNKNVNTNEEATTSGTAAETGGFSGWWNSLFGGNKEEAAAEEIQSETETFSDDTSILDPYICASDSEEVQAAPPQSKSATFSVKKDCCGVLSKKGARYKSSTIPYYVDEDCKGKRRENILAAINFIAAQTGISFREESDYMKHRIFISCITDRSILEEANKGEKSPTLFTGGLARVEGATVPKTGEAVIIEAQIFLLDDETRAPSMGVIEVHELLHALGFPDTQNDKSIMIDISSLEKCKSNVEVDEDIIKNLNALYTPEKESIYSELGKKYKL